MSLVESVTLGADPELVLIDSTTGNPVPAWKLTKGTKKEHEMIDKKMGLSIHADGTALEYNFTSKPLGSFAGQARRAWELLINYVHARGYDVHTVSEVTGYSAEDLMHPLALESGCDPDFSAYNEIPETPRAPLLYTPKGPRFTGGHIHVGYDKAIGPPDWVMARLMEVFWYLPIISYDQQGARRRHHGQAGVFRPKSYGVEYRTPSNFWVHSNGQLEYLVERVSWIFHRLEDSAERINEWFHHDPALWPSVQKAIAENDTAAATRIYKKAVNDISTSGPLR